MVGLAFRQMTVPQSSQGTSFGLRARVAYYPLTTETVAAAISKVNSAARVAPTPSRNQGHLRRRRDLEMPAA